MGHLIRETVPEVHKKDEHRQNSKSYKQFYPSGVETKKNMFFAELIEYLCMSIDPYLQLNLTCQQLSFHLKPFWSVINIRRQKFF